MAEETKSFEFEVAMDVERFLSKRDARTDWKEAKNDAFERCAKATDHAIKEAKRDLREAKAKRADLKAVEFSARFVEFDSGNIIHAYAIFMATAAGPAEAIDRLRAAHRLWTGDTEE